MTEDFDFDLIFEKEEKPEFDKELLDKPVSDYGEDPPEPSGGVRQPRPGNDPKRGPGTSLKPPVEEKELVLVAV